MKTEKEIKHAVNVTNEIKNIIETNFERIPLYEDTPNVFGFRCKIDDCKEIVGSAERLKHLQREHDLPYFITGEEALKWILE